MGYRDLFLIMILMMIPIAIVQMVSAADLKDIKTGMEVRLQLGPSTDKTILKPSETQPLPDGPKMTPFKKEPPAMHRVTVIQHRRALEPPPRQRHPELSSEQLVVAAFDTQGREINRVVIADPRLVRAETVGPSGELITETFYRESAEFTIGLPDDPNITMLKIYHPHWTGTEFILEPIGETQLP